MTKSSDRFANHPSETSRLTTSEPNGVHGDVVQCSTPPKRRFHWLRLASILLMLAVAYSAGRLSRTATTVAESTVGVDPIMALKKDSYLDELKNGAVAADHIVCSNLGNSILLKGGNAVDAAVTTVLCLGVANPASSGLGGGAFILVHSDRQNHKARYNASTSPSFIDKRDASFPPHAVKVTEVIDCREAAPAAATQGMFTKLPPSASSIGGLAIAIPAELRGLELAHSRHGSLSWAELVEPVVKLAREGVPVSMHLAGDIKSIAEVKSKKYGEYPSLRNILTKQDNWTTALQEGELLKNEKLAQTLERIAAKGSKALYEGELANLLVKEVQEEGGILTVEDLQNYKPVIRSPIFGIANGFTLIGVPPPSSGGAAVIGAARFLAGYQAPMASFAYTLAVHRTVEAFRHAFAIRMSLSDPAYYSNVTAEAVADLTTGSYMESLRKMTRDNSTLSPSEYGGPKWAQLHNVSTNPIEDHHEGDRRLRGSQSSAARLDQEFGYLEDRGTTHLSIVDKDGNAVAITSSINQVFGSYVMSKSTGILLGNTMDDFGNPGRSNYYGLKPSKSNFISPGKRPLSSMSPTMVFRRAEGADNREYGDLQLVVGGSGGPKIITCVLQVIINYCFLGWPLFDAVARARVHDQLMYHDAFVTTTEKSVLDQGPTIEVPQRTKTALLSRGHETLLNIDYAGTVQAVAVDLETKLLSSVSDIRKGGTPAGY